MNFLEKYLEQIIYESDRLALSERGLDIYGVLKRQVRIGNYGVAGLVTIKKPFYNKYFNLHHKGEITVYELKQNKINIDTFLQAIGYLNGIRDYLKNTKEKDLLFNYNIVLIGSKIDQDSNFCYLPNFLSADNSENTFIYDEPILKLKLYEYNYAIDGITFKSKNS